MRLIDADALIPMMKYATTDSEIGVFPIKIGFDAIVKVINAQPTIERKTGKWLYKENEWNIWYECSICGEKAPRDSIGRPWDRSDYCPNCGADMRGGEHA